VLLQCGAPKPTLDDALRSAPVVSVPIPSVFSDSTTHDEAFADLGRANVLTGVSTARYETRPEIIDRAKAGKIADFASGGTINAERIIADAPAIFMADRDGDPAFVELRAAGIPVIVDTEWLEQSALGRAEWIKFISLFLNEEHAAN